jgi:hypothetical protein
MRTVIVLLSFVAAALALTADPAAELGNLNFKNIIGGPMGAAVDAQIKSSAQSIAFITQVGLRKVGSAYEVVMVSFNYNQKLNNGTIVDKSMSIPFLYMVPIPYLRIEKLDIDFVAKINSVESNDSAFDIKGVVNASGGTSFGENARVDISGSVSVQYTTKSSAQVKRDYSMQIHVECTQAEMPGGMERVLQLFETIIQTDNPSL